MPEPTAFLSRSPPVCSIVRPTGTTGAAAGALKFLTDMNLFLGQPNDFFTLMKKLDADADAATRVC